MANTIQIKRKPKNNGAGVPNNLVAGELAFSEADNKLFYGLYESGANATPIEIGGSGYVLAKISENAPTKSGSGATGTWNISVTGNAGTVTNGVYTTGTQTINGSKTFGDIITFSSGLSVNSQKITNLAAPTSANDAATKAYVDASRLGLDVKDSVRVATTTNITLTGTQTIDGVSVIAGDRVLVKDQDTGSQNGIYVVAAGAWSRATDADVDTEVTAGMFTFVTEGTANGDTGWVLTTNDTITLNTTALTFAQFSGAGTIIAGTGLTKSGNTISLSSAYGDTVNPYGSKSANTILAGPTTGASSAPSFRSLVANDIPSLGNITNSGAIGSVANLPIITTTNGVLTTGSFGTSANTFCSGNDPRLSDTRNTTNSLTVNNAGAGTASPFTFNGGTAQTLSYNSIGAPSISGANATGTWNISISGNAATVTSGVYTSRSLTAGSGLAGGGDLSLNRTFDIGQGDGISVGDDTISVDSTVVRTSGNQTIDGNKTFNGSINGPINNDNEHNFAIETINGNFYGEGIHLGFAGPGNRVTSITSPYGYPFDINTISAGIVLRVSSVEKARITSSGIGIGTSDPNAQLHIIGSGIFASGIISSGNNSFKTPSSASSGTHFPVFTSDPSNTAQVMYTRTPSQVKGDIGLGNVENTALSSWAGSTNLTTLGTISNGTWSATTIAVNKGGTGKTSYNNGELLIGSGNSLISNTLTAGSAIAITNGSGTITINHGSTSSLSAGTFGGNGISSILIDSFGHITGINTSTYLTSATVCSAISSCTIDGGEF